MVFRFKSGFHTIIELFIIDHEDNDIVFEYRVQDQSNEVQIGFISASIIEYCLYSVGVISKLNKTLLESLIIVPVDRAAHRYVF